MRGRVQIGAMFVGISLVLALYARISVGSAGSMAKKQRIAIEEKGGEQSGTFTLIPLTPGPLKADSGTWTFSGATQQPTVIRNGQSVMRFKGYVSKG